MGRIGEREHGTPRGEPAPGAARMHLRRGAQRQTGMLMGVGVPGKQRLGPGPRILATAEAIGRARVILYGFKRGLRKRVVIGDVRAAVALGAAQIVQQGRHVL
jgi:hypothetical protein